MVELDFESEELDFDSEELDFDSVEEVDGVLVEDEPPSELPDDLAPVVSDLLDEPLSPGFPAPLLP